MKVFLFVVLFAAILFKLGVNVRSVIIAFCASFVVMLALGMLMSFIKIIPVLIVVAVGISLYKKYM